MSEEESRPRLVVRDRRSFTRSGERRQPDPAPDEAAPTELGSDEATSTEPGPEEPASTDPGSGEGTPAGRGPEEPAPDDAGTPADDPRFQQLVHLLHMQAAMLLDRHADEGEDAEARRTETLAGLEATIDLLEVIQEKTRDRLGATDERFLSQVLFQLRMAYMRLLQAPAEKDREPA